jgi:hypothetical protein
MKPDPQFVNLDPRFWAYVRTISEAGGYTARGTGRIVTPSPEQIRLVLGRLGLADREVVAQDGQSLTPFGQKLTAYFEHRASLLNDFVEPRLMNAQQAGALFRELRRGLKPTCPLPMNKQKKAKKKPAFFTGAVNMLIEANTSGFSCDFDPRAMTTITRDGLPVRTLARRVDGAFPSVVNPVAVWEIKEYYYTTTFGSRVADGVYESLLDGMELAELREHEHIDVKHCLMIDAHYTWWECGKSYLCRIIDMLYMGYVDEVLFGREIVDRLPQIVREWCDLARPRSAG